MLAAVIYLKLSAEGVRRKSKSEKTLTQYSRAIKSFVKWLQIACPSSITEDENAESFYRLILPLSSEVK